MAYVSVVDVQIHYEDAGRAAFGAKRDGSGPDLQYFQERSK
ncbi:hypothetical protein [Desulfosporosinus fructosivorans]